MSDKEMRIVYAETLIALAEKDPRIVVLEADLMKASGMALFMKKFPERTFDMGVAEANMVGTAAGLSAGGKIPFAHTFACFVTRRAFDQIFISAAYAMQNVKLVGSDPGITAAFNGGTHMPFEDAGIMRTIPKMVVFEPSDPVSLEKLTVKNYEFHGSTYMRLFRKPAPVLYSETERFELGKAKVLCDGTDAAIFATGVVMVHAALDAAMLLQKEGISAAVIDMHTIKPLDDEMVLHYAKKTGAVVTCENHQVINGLGSAVAEILSEQFPTRLKRIGINDEFGEVGTQAFLQTRFGLTAPQIADTIKSFLTKN